MERILIQTVGEKQLDFDNWCVIEQEHVDNGEFIGDLIPNSIIISKSGQKYRVIGSSRIGGFIIKRK